MDDCTDLSLKILGKSIKSIPLFIKGILIKCLIFNFGLIMIKSSYGDVISSASLRFTLTS